MPTKTFLDALFSGKAPDDYILIWEKYRKNPGNTSYWTRNIDEAVKVVKSLETADSNVYFGCGTSPQDFGKHLRCERELISGIPGVWLDVDMDTPDDPAAHAAGKNYPPNEIIIQDFMSHFHIDPTIVIFSGHGFHFWWLFEEFWRFEDNSQRVEAARIVQEFIETFKQYFKVNGGYDLDSVYDLARVLRPPGTINKKTDKFVPCAIYSNNGPRHLMTQILVELQEFQKSFAFNREQLEQKKRGLEKVKYSINTYQIKADAVPPEPKFQTLMDTNEKFSASWQMVRKDMKDQSASAYDFSLANIAMANEWSWQEIIDMLIAFRRENKLEPKLRELYYITTLDNVQKTAYRKESEENVRMLTNESIETNFTPKRKREEIRNNISVLLGIIIDRIIKYTGDPSVYKLVSEGRVITLGPINNLVEQRLFRHKVMDVTGKPIRLIDKNRWNNIIVPALLEACEEEDTGVDATTKGTVANWITNYLEYGNPQYDADEAMQFNRPFFYDRYLYLSSPSLRQYLVTILKEGNANQRAIGIMLKEYGFKPQALHFTDMNGKRNFRNLWRIGISDEAVAPFLKEDLLEEANRIRCETIRVRGPSKASAEYRPDDLGG